MAIYYSNRSICHIKMENYGLAIQDAELAIQMDSLYSKAYYRKADACIALSKFQDAKTLLKKVP